MGNGACAIAVDEGFLHVPSSSGPSQLWLDKLHIVAAAAQPGKETGDGETVVLQDAGHLFLTNVTFDGQDRHARALYLSNADMRSPELHAEGELPASCCVAPADASIQATSQNPTANHQNCCCKAFVLTALGEHTALRDSLASPGPLRVTCSSRVERFAISIYDLATLWHGADS